MNKYSNILKTIFTYLAILIYFQIIFKERTYNFMLVLLFFILYLFYKKNSKVVDNMANKYSKIFSLLLSIVLIVGSIVYSCIGTKDAIIFNVHNVIYTIVGSIGFYYFFEVITTYILVHLPNICDSKSKPLTRKYLIIIFITIFVCWLPYFLRYYPGLMSNDSYHIFYYVENGILNDHHTFGHTWFVGIIYLLGKVLFHNLNAAVAFYTIIQMLICDYIFVYIIKFLNELKVKKIYLYICIGLFALSPLYAIYSLTIWRDILFGMTFPVLFITLYRYIRSGYKLSWELAIPYLISIIFMLFMRNNGIYILILFTPFLVLLSKNYKEILLVVNVLIIIMYYIIKGPIFNYFKIANTESVESFSIPLQQISRVITMDEQIDDKSYNYLNSIMDVSSISDSYDPTISDPVKWLVDSSKLSTSKGEFIGTWLRILVMHPRIYVESYLSSTLGYWYPDVIYWATVRDSKSIFPDLDIYTDSKLPNLTIIDSTTSRRIPLSNLIWSPGLMFILLIFSSMLLVYKKESKYLLCYIPLYALWISLMLATPVFAELRYIYGLFTCMPLLLVIPLVINNKD